MKTFKQHVEQLDENYSKLTKLNVTTDSGAEYVDVDGQPIPKSMKLAPDLYLKPHQRLSDWYILVQVKRSGQTEIEISKSHLQYLGQKV